MQGGQFRTGLLKGRPWRWDKLCDGETDGSPAAGYGRPAYSLLAQFTKRKERESTLGGSQVIPIKNYNS